MPKPHTVPPPLMQTPKNAALFQRCPGLTCMHVATAPDSFVSSLMFLMACIGGSMFTFMSTGSTSHLHHIETVNYNSILCKLFWYNMQVLCKLNRGIYMTAVCRLKYVESDVMWYNIVPIMIVE